MDWMEKLERRIAALVVQRAKELAEKEIDGFVELAWLDKNQDQIKLSQKQKEWVQRAFELGYEPEDFDVYIHSHGDRWYYQTTFFLHNEILRESPEQYLYFPEHKTLPKNFVVLCLKNQEIAFLRRNIDRLEREIADLRDDLNYYREKYGE